MRRRSRIFFVFRSFSSLFVVGRRSRALRRRWSGLRRKIQFVIVAQRFQCAEGFYPEILSTEESLPDLILGHRPLVLDFFYDDEPEVVEAMVRAPEMLVYRD